jgi:hypothetical protein
MSLPNRAGAYVPAGPYNAPVPVVTVATNGPLNIKSGIIRLTKATAAAAILPNPSAGDDGLLLRLVNGSAAAHIITGSYADGVTGGLKTTITMAAFAGASISLVALNRSWSVLAINAAPVT